MALLGKTLRLFLVDGTPSGIVIAEIINWSGQVIRLPRALLSEFLERKESDRTGIYLLVGDDEEVPGRLRVYVGESDNVGSRLRQHANDVEKSFWDFACVILSKDQNLTKAHALFLEAKIIEKASLADRVTLDNSKISPYDSIPESDVSDMTYFFEQTSVLLPALGIEVFQPKEFEKVFLQDLAPPGPTVFDSMERRSPRSSLEPVTGPKAIEVVLKDGKYGIEARGVESNGEILVANGSQARGVNESETNIYRQLRDRLIKEQKLCATSDPRVMEFKSDVLFNSPSAASAVILDRNDNGRTSWKEKHTLKSLNDWYAAQANLVNQHPDITDSKQ
jgi:hypothetical protein